jgi:hypothetical protein
LSEERFKPMANGIHIYVKYQKKGSPPLELENILNPELIAETTGEYIPLPNVGDVLDCKNVGGRIQGKTAKYRVRARYLTFWENHCTVFLIITDLEEEKARPRGGVLKSHL